MSDGQRAGGREAPTMRARGGALAGAGAEGKGRRWPKMRGRGRGRGPGVVAV